MRALQLERLRAAVAWAGERVPFYRSALAEAGLEGSTLKSLEDLERLPFTRKAHLREHYPWGLFAVAQPELARVHASSGTKGKPTVVGYTRTTSYLAKSHGPLPRGRRRPDPAKLIQVEYGYGSHRRLGLHDGAEHMGLTVVPGPREYAQADPAPAGFRPQAWACTPSFRSTSVRR